VHFSVVGFIQAYSVAKCYLEVQTYKNIHVGFVTHNADRLDPFLMLFRGTNLKEYPYWDCDK